MRVRSLVLTVLVTAACEGPPSAPESPPVSSVEVLLSPTRTVARGVNNYLINYGAWDAAKIAVAQQHQLVILDPNERDMSRQLVQQIQGGTDPGDPSRRVIVLCYISIGEDLRTGWRTDAQMAGDARFVGDGTGPRMDPRGPLADGQPLGGIDPRGLPSNGGTGYASYYLDDNSVHFSPDHVGDGKPDRNGNFNTCFVNAGDPKWFDALQDMTLDGPDRIAGLREILTTTTGRGLGCDGVFLDTIDTAAPNRWTDASSSNPTKFEWTAPGFAAFLERLRAAYPDVVVLQNRGLFFFNPFNPQYRFIPRGNLDFVMFESFRLNSGASNNPNPYFYPDNRYNLGPKLMAEANREGGFRVLSLGYAEGPPDQMSEATLTGQSMLGYDSLLEDIRVTERETGFRHYLTDSSVTLVNRFVEDHADRSDDAPPVWTSTWNDHNPGYPIAPAAPTPRVGVQEVVPGPASLTVRWDTALDLGRVGYALYYRTTPFDFAADPTLATATRVVVPPAPGAGYASGVGARIFASEATLTGLVPGQTYYLVVRAFDDAPVVHEDANQVVLTGVPEGTTPALSRWRASNGVTSLTYRFQVAGSWAYRRVYIDRDRVTGTGFATGGIGADFLIEEGRLYRYTGTGSSWGWSAVMPNPVTQRTGSAGADLSFVEWTLAQSDLGAGDRRTTLLFQVQRPGSVKTGVPYAHEYTTSDPASPMLEWFAENDQNAIYYHADVNVPFTYKHIFIDVDADAATGYSMAGVGAEYLIENGTLYRQSAPGWSWARVTTAHLVVNGAKHDWWISRSDVGAAAAGAPTMRVVFQANGGSPTFVAPVYTHRFSP